MTITEYQKSTLKNLEKMEKQTKNHMKNCSCHVCIYKRDIKSRPEIRRLLH